MTEIEQAFQRGAEAMRQVCVKALQDEVNRLDSLRIGRGLADKVVDCSELLLTLELPKSTEGGP